MDIGEKITVLENIIYQFACTQFELNQIPATQARVILQCVYSRFQEQCLNAVLMSRVSIQQTGAMDNGEKRTGTPEDLLKAYESSGFNKTTGEEQQS